MASVLPPCYDHRVVGGQAPIKSYSIVVPVNGVTSFNYGAADQVLQVYETPAIKTINMGSTRRRGTFAVAQTGVANLTTNVVLQKKPSAGIVRWQTRGNLYVQDSQNVNRLTNCYNPLQMSFQEAQGSQELDWSMLASDSATPNLRYDDTAFNPERVNYLRYKMKSAGPNTAIPATPYDYPLKDMFKGQSGFLGLDKYYAWPEIMQLQVTTAGLNLEAYTDDGAGNFAAIAVNATIASDNLYVDIEMNDFWIKATLSECLSGKFAQPIPYQFPFKQNLAQGTTFSAFNQRLGNQFGQYLKKVVWAVYNGTESSVTCCDHSNMNVAGVPPKITSWYELIDQNRIYPFDISCADATPIDIMIMQPALKESVLGNYRDIFRYNYVNETRFDKMNNKSFQVVNPDNLACGLDLTKGDRMYTLNLTLPGTISTNLYIWFICERFLSIDSTGVHIS